MSNFGIHTYALTEEEMLYLLENDDPSYDTTTSLTGCISQHLAAFNAAEICLKHYIRPI